MVSQDPSFPQGYRFWDSWYLHSHGEFHALMLCAEQHYYEAGDHHEYSRLAYARSRDLIHWDGHKVVLAAEANASIWSGSVIRWGGEYLLAYTIRRTIRDYFAGQTIGLARSTDFVNWVRFDGELTIDDVDPDGRYFLSSPEVSRDRTVHAWRDPYLFVYRDQLLMLVAAKRHDVPPDRRGCVALLRADQNGSSNFRWRLMSPSLVSGYEELEVPQVYVDQRRRAWVIASTWDDSDYEISWLRGNRPTVKSSPQPYRRHGYLLGFRASSIDALLDGDFDDDNTGAVLLGPEAMLYAGRIVPEQPGTVLGFDPRTGSPKVVRRELPTAFEYVTPSVHRFARSQSA